jgi:mannose-6-phosphate isomerase-like protein (cupin superfamily)
MNKKIILDAIKSKEVLVLNSLIKDPISWDIFFQVFKSRLPGGVNFQFFGGYTIKDSEGGNEYFNDLVHLFDNSHPGKKIATMSIVHFVNRTDNYIPEEAKDFYKDFIDNNPKHYPEGFDLNLLQPARHSDAVDGFFVQCAGQTLWRIYYSGERVESFIARPGDVLFIPSGLEHSVESLSPRASISISFTDS